jgi:hypothetical protein
MIQSPPLDQRIKLPCQCGGCGTPYAVVQNGVLVIIARHNGEKHTNVLRLEDVERLLRTIDKP